jgi:hypothetical protein
MQGSSVAIQTPTQWNLIMSSMTTLPPEILPCIIIIIMPPLSHCTFIPTKEKFGTHFKHVIYVFCTFSNIA